MPALLLAAAFIALTILVLLLAGVLAAVLTGVGLLNVLVLVLGLRAHRARPAPPRADEGWRPKSFRRAPLPRLEDEDEERLHRSLTVHRR